MLNKTEQFCKFFYKENIFFFGCVIELLKRGTCDQHSLGSKSTRAILPYPWERYFTSLFAAWWSRQAIKLVLTLFKKISAFPTISFTARHWYHVS